MPPISNTKSITALFNFITQTRYKAAILVPRDKIGVNSAKMKCEPPTFILIMLISWYNIPCPLLEVLRLKSGSPAYPIQRISHRLFFKFSSTFKVAYLYLEARQAWNCSFTDYDKLCLHFAFKSIINWIWSYFDLIQKVSCYIFILTHICVEQQDQQRLHIWILYVVIYYIFFQMLLRCPNFKIL